MPAPPGAQLRGGPPEPSSGIDPESAPLDPESTPLDPESTPLDPESAPPSEPPVAEEVVSFVHASPFPPAFSPFEMAQPAEMPAARPNIRSPRGRPLGVWTPLALL